MQMLLQNQYKEMYKLFSKNYTEKAEMIMHEAVVPLSTREENAYQLDNISLSVNINVMLKLMN